MKLYTRPGACSTADHIALHWSGERFEAKVLSADDLKSPEFLAVNPSGTVPALEDGDFVLTQNAAILGYIADRAPAARLLGDGSARERAEATRWLSFVACDVHPAFHLLFFPERYVANDARGELTRNVREKLRGMFERADRQFEARDWIAGFRSVADPYLYITLRWALRTGVDLEGLENLSAFRQRMDDDPGVRAALAAEGLS